MSGIQLFYWENEIPILSPDNIPMLDVKTLEITGLEITIVLRVSMADQIRSEIQLSPETITEKQLESETSQVLCFHNSQLIVHYNFSFISVHRTLFFKTKKSIHFLIIRL